MNPMVLVVYRQGIATLVLAPITIMANRTKLKEMRLGWTGFFTVFVAAFIGVASGIAVNGDGHDELDTGHHLADGSHCRVSA
ncbi:hypothetical protein EJB05_43102 [Eragrostis curvula]|uniref:WAT1-related protein n=1 Tax=Eragrostis curvula TaxID=38414 RepID=A0A5J9TF29_9POAL|nr:hypothetical protein EJB05_43102 [Eragrostis curvula]